ncbi:MAG: hypothetical protein ABUL60_28090 [Myxococcales bacterium]
MKAPLLCLPLVLVLACGGTSGTSSDASAAGKTSTAVGAGSSGAGVGGATTAGNGSGAGSNLPGAIPIVPAMGGDVPYQLGTNTYGISGGAFLAKSPMGATTVVLDDTQVGKICLKGTVEMVPTPADGSHPPYSQYWGIDLGFNLNQAADATAGSEKTPWTVPPGVVGFWFTVEGAMIPQLRFKTTPTGKDPAQEQDSCAVVSPLNGVPNQVLFKDMFVQCWDGPEGTGVTDISQGLLDVGLQVAADTNAAQPIDFCVTGFGVVEK